MNKDKKIIVTVSLAAFAILLGLLLLPMKESKIWTALMMTAIAVLARLLIRKKSSLSINKREVLLLSLIIAVLYELILQVSGIFFGFYKNPYFVHTSLFLKTIIPVAAIIIASELFRNTMLAQNNTFAAVLAFCSCLIAEVLSFSNVAQITSFNQFMDLMGLHLLPAIGANLYYNYVSRRYGALPNIMFRLITTLYSYFMYKSTATPDVIVAMIKLVIPVVTYALISALYEKKKKPAIQKGRKLTVFSTILTSVIIISIAMLISCQFRFGAVVIATESMTGEINKGDMIIYEQYKKQKIDEGQVIVFLEDGNRIIHRVVKIEIVDNEARYFTKGDANEDLDVGYRTNEDIVGLTDIKISYIGFPTLWLRSLLEGSN